MDAKQNARMLLRYMRAHLRNVTGKANRDWTVSEVIDSFLLLPPPDVEFSEWLRQAADEGVAEPATGDWRDENEMALEMLRRSAPPNLRIIETKANAG
ncbi:MAG: hypothetical protein N3A66_08540 [Planctomycetota bacterium]|nr:hypothetical protein [Planctomycetota bacterium]